MEPRTLARVHTGLRVQPCPHDPSSGNQDPKAKKEETTDEEESKPKKTTKKAAAKKEEE